MLDGHSTVSHDELVASIDSLFGRLDRQLTDLAGDVEETYRIHAASEDEEWPHNAA